MRPRRSVVDRVLPAETANPRPNIRLRVVGLCVVVLFSLMVVRLWYLQVLDTASYTQAVNANTIRPVEEPAPRGLILDRNDSIMVGNTVFTDVTLTRLQAQQHPEVIGQLAALLGLSPDQIQSDLNNPQYNPYKAVPILENAPLDAVAAIRENPGLYPGVVAVSDTQRNYPLGQTGIQMLGFVRQITSQQLAAGQSAGYQPGDVYGQDGLELQYQAQLRGTPGIDQMQVNAKGQVVGRLGRTPPVPGGDLVTNIDVGLQKTLQSALDTEIASLRGQIDPSTKKVAKPTGGAAVAIDPQTGAVLALVSNPTYDPTIWQGSVSQAQVAQVDLAFNRAISGFYTPGSTFKLATATAALQTGLITPSTPYDDTGLFDVPGCVVGAPGCITYRDNDSGGSGWITVQAALTVSSDTFFYNLGAEFWDSRGQYGREPIQNVAAQYGYGQVTHIDLPGEDAGSYARVDSPTVVAKEHAQDPAAYPYGNWTTGNNVQMAFGQGGTSITPLEQAVAYATFANGGTRYVPQVAAGIVDPNSKKVLKVFAPQVVGHVPLSDADRQAMVAGFTGVVQSANPLGTAYGSFDSSSYPPFASSGPFPFDKLPLAGKTGTASANGQVPTSWFVGWGPVDNPRYLIAVVIEGGGFGATAAAPVARQGFEYLVNNPEQPVRFVPPAPPVPGTVTPVACVPGPRVSATTTSAPGGGTTTTTAPSGCQTGYQPAGTVAPTTTTTTPTTPTTTTTPTVGTAPSAAPGRPAGGGPGGPGASQSALPARRHRSPPGGL